VSLPVVVHHLLRDILFVAQRRCASGPTVRASSATTSSRPVDIVRARTASPITRDALGDDRLLDLGVGFCRLRSGLAGGKPKGQPQQERQCRQFVHSCCFCFTPLPSNKVWGFIFRHEEVPQCGHFHAAMWINWRHAGQCLNSLSFGPLRSFMAHTRAIIHGTPANPNRLRMKMGPALRYP